jgi:hypothetical protein
MYYFFPEGYLSHTHREIEGGLMPKLEDKVGGIAYGLTKERYPFCKQCGLPMTFIAQFIHHSQRFDLGREGRVLFAFDCLNNCDTWNPDSGANTCFILEPEMLIDTFVDLPDQSTVIDFYIKVRKWKRAGNGIPNNLYQCFFTSEKYNELVDKGMLDRIPSSTSIGGVPYWLQNPPKGFERDWKFLGQISALDFSYNDDIDIWGGGMAYIFMSKAEDTSIVPQCKFFYQCT